MTYYDDCLYCSTCGWHHNDCWCRGGVLRDDDEPVFWRADPHEGPGGYRAAAQPCTPSAATAAC